MDAGVVANCRPQAFAARTAVENFLNRGRACADVAGTFSAAGRNATAAADSRAGSSPALPLLTDAPRHRRRRGALYPTPRRSQRHPTPFFSNLLETRRLKIS
jgi:hypothetical protein